MLSAILGRDDSTSRLRDDVDRTVSSHGGLVLISGEAGIGKTTLVGSAVEHARAIGAIPVVGTCSSSPAAPALWPWTQVLRAMQRALGATDFGAFIADAGLDPTDLTTLAEPEADPEFGLFDSIASMLAAVAHVHPLVIVVEDLHWADVTTIDLLAHLARHTWFERLLLIGTYRDTEIDGSDAPAHRALQAIAPQAGTLAVSGLDVEAVEALARRVSGRQPPAAVIADLHRRTGGNPFFVEQTARLWAGGYGEHVLAPGVIEAVRRRLAPLPQDAISLLRAAAIVENPSSLRTIAQVTGMPFSRASAAGAAALSARLLRVDGEGLYSFVHDLVRETVLTDLDDDSAAELHAAVVRALEEYPDAVLPGQAAEHALAAGGSIPAERTVDLLVAAGRDANSRLDLAASMDCYSRAAALTADPDRRALILLDLATEMHFAAIMRRESDDAAIALMDELLDGSAQWSAATGARIALGLQQYSELDAERVRGLLRRSAAALLPPPLPPDEELAMAVVQQLSETAREGSDHEALTAMLTLHHASLWRPGTAPERQRVMHELELVARRAGDRDTEQFAASMQWVTMLEQNDPGYLEQYRVFATLASRYRTPRLAPSEHVDGALISAFRGRFDEARERFATATSMLPSENLFRWVSRYMAWNLHLLRGEWAAGRTVLESLLGGELDNELLMAVQCSAERRFDEAVQHLRRVDSHGDHLPQVVYDRVTALVAAGTGDPALIARSRERLAGLSGTWSVDLYGMDLGGPVDLYLAMVEAADGHRERAIELVERAIDQAEQLATPYWAAMARLELLEMLSPSDPRLVAIRERLRDALDRVDAPAVCSRIEAVLEPGVPSSEIVPLIARLSEGEFRREGVTWRVGIGGTSVSVPDAKGLRDLHALLSSPGNHIASVDLLAPGGGPETVVAARLGGDPILDDTAREQYRARLDQLDELLDAAGGYGESERRDALLAERAALIDELRAATGLGGRARRLGDQAERARKTVGARIRDTLRRLDDVHPELAAHLRASVSTGSACAYRPEEPISWVLR
ncbi:hypothetical protein BHE97_01750 [Aeromicrobium sp. PE09-221]|uniref:ATP-binding protein n=1 Tax=Aeromicrobium sp. PE09-221 TaxID=1898043 RepID=UPI000B3E8797|nr:AAA family ATPase [Aeromicrobium sp. PE09-221]OUZ12460.1 hypothetical protein BHE97_01750 [Aeromicrobium sp. PE09-221]